MSDGNGTDGKDPFELEPEPEPAPRPRPEPVEPPPADDRAPPPPPETRRRAHDPNAAPVEAVDERTVAERRGAELPRGADEVLAPPPEWPQEALAFPWRTPGPAFLLLGGGMLVLLDLLGMVPAVAFLGYILKPLALIVLLRGVLHVVGTSAAGQDAPVGWARALEFGPDELWAFVRTLGWLTLLLLPGVLLYVFDQPGWATLAVVAGTLLSSVVMLGAALGDRALALPWNALPWVASRPLACLVGGLGWWVLFATEAALAALADEAFVLQLLLALVLRAACMATLLVAARAMGVMGRAWTAA